MQETYAVQIAPHPRWMHLGAFELFRQRARYRVPVAGLI